MLQPHRTELVLGIGNLVCEQLRCISLLTLPMYCGKPGRGVLKAVVLTYVIAGPITNMGLNAKEVVRVFACSTQLSYNLSKTRYSLTSAPFKKAIFDLRTEVSQIKDTIRSIRDVVTPIEYEMENQNEMYQNRKRKYEHFVLNNSSPDDKQQLPNFEDKDYYQALYSKKLEYRCQNVLSRASTFCMEIFASVYEQCQVTSHDASWVLWRPVEVARVCNIKETIGDEDICDNSKYMNPGLGEGYDELKKAKKILADNKDVSLQYKINTVRELYDIQDAKETGDRVMHAFEEKYIIMRTVITAVNVCVALLFLRIFLAAVTYHDQYLTNIEYDNVYVTSYFKRIDARRKKKDKYTLLPLKKMERSKYVDVHSFSYKSSEREKLVTHILKVTLEVVTATTFVMLDRLFYEALDVVRQHAASSLPGDANRDLEIQVEGTGTLASMMRKVLGSLNNSGQSAHEVSNSACLPRPRLMPPLFYVKIYGGYLWIVLLLYVNPYTVRLRRLICSYFYPCREKQRILHLYNDILKKRMKMQKTLRRKAIQAVRAHYLSGENLLSLRIKFPRLLGWLRVLPAARMSCLICGETEPRSSDRTQSIESESWQSCAMAQCPFVYCGECWREAGARCLACDPRLAELSDAGSWSEEEVFKC
ncbi:protein sneaky-like [Ostrinia nubilalis]|uniref:protein sneaky-like n=1 Tax=Ostrinia nubilalis TaxID=29057 RepID=UPI00308234E6